MRNPYTGKRVFVGCLCCKKVPDFEADRAKYESNENIAPDGTGQEMKTRTPNPMEENQKKIRTVKK